MSLTAVLDRLAPVDLLAKYSITLVTLGIVIPALDGDYQHFRRSTLGITNSYRSIDIQIYSNYLLSFLYL